MTRSTVVLGACVLAAVVSTRWVRVNVSPSVPLGLYRLQPVNFPLTRGALVLLPVPLAVRPWHSRWLPLLKPVAAIAGDVVCVEDERLQIRGDDYGPVYQEAHGQRLPRLEGCQAVPEGEVFLASAAPKSLDGRYYGMAPIAILTAQVIPLLTWR